MKRYRWMLILLVGTFIITFYLKGQISNTKHNLSANSSGTYKSNTESQICIFCHAPHNSADKKALWNRNNPSLTFTIYNSSTTHASITQPDGSSLLCLSCHDGSIALGSIVSNSSPIIMNNGVTVLPSSERSNLTKDLTNDHPVSFNYDASLVSANGNLVAPASIHSSLHLENGKMQCTSCHDPHDNTNTNFLNMSNDGSNTNYLCTGCHNITNWNSSLHKTQSNTSWSGSGTTPWPHTAFTNVISNACENCHNPHQAGGSKRLLNYNAEESNCLNCHNGNLRINGTGIKNISQEFTRTYKHNIAGYTGVHDPTENNEPSTKHVECVDCHNPHQANNTNSTSSAPTLKGSLYGVSGINSSGSAVATSSYEYEICFKCHAGNSWSPGSVTSRNISQNNTRLEFATTSISFHPVVGTNANANTASLLTGWSSTSRVYCSNCHGSNGTNLPNGPHGSTTAQILKGNYTRTDPANYNVNNYTLCWQCHSSTIVVSENTSSFRYHNLHVNNESTSCNVCHDPHGISSSQGTASGNSHLINFQTGVVTGPNGTGQGYYVHQPSPTVRGRCYLRCHGQTHNPESY